MASSQSNITVLASSLGLGGAEHALNDMLRGLNKERFRPRLLCLRDLKFLGEALQATDIPALGNLSRGKYDPLVGFRLARAVGKSVDILYCLDNHNVLFWAPYLLRRARVKAAVAICHATRNPSGDSNFRAADRAALRRVDRIIAVSHGQKRYLAQEEGLSPERIEVIYNGVHIERFGDPRTQAADRASVRQELGLKEDDRVGAIIAHIRPEKNHQRFLRVACTVAQRLARARFIVAGDGPQRSNLERQVHSQGLGERFRFVGARHDIPRLLAAADVVTLTSDDRVETFPISLLEAMAAGRPVVATRVGSLDEMVIDGENGHLVPVHDEAAFAEALYRLLSDPGRADAMGGAARRLVQQRFTAERMVEQHERLFERLLSAYGGRNGRS